MIVVFLRIRTNKMNNQSILPIFNKLDVELLVVCMSARRTTTKKGIHNGNR